MRSNPILEFDPRPRRAADASATRSITSPKARSSLVLNALGDSLLGPPIAEALGLPRDTARELAAQRLRHRLEVEHPRG